MTRFRLGINAGFAINRFPEPEVWLRIVGEDLGLRYVQFVADLLNPFLPPEVIGDQTARVRESARRYNVKIDTTFMSAFTRVNHLLHPDALQRDVWFDWFKRWLKIAADLGARGSGGHFGILSVTDFKNKEQRALRIKEGVSSWQQLARFGSERGLQFLIIEPMSIPREMAATIDSAKQLLETLNGASLPIPIRLCLDVDHGDLGSPDQRDRNPYAWLKELSHLSPVIHIKQSTPNKGGHWPFTQEHNRMGTIQAPRVLESISASGAEEVVLLLEISHRERYPAENRVLDDLRDSVRYWRRFVAD